jgi:FixJ family two-component response regulator
VERIQGRTNLSRKRQHIKTPLVSIVDDDWSLVEATVSLVQSLGYSAEGFRSAEDFLESKQLLKTDCLILDIRMPSMGGFELQRRLAAGNYRMPIIFVTSYDSENMRTQAVQTGAVEFLCKPFSQESLSRAVRSALGKQKQDRS